MPVAGSLPGHLSCERIVPGGLSEIPQKLHRLANLGCGVGAVAAGDREVATILLLFEDGENLGQVGAALAERNLDAARLGQVARGVGRVDMQDVRTQSP